MLSDLDWPRLLALARRHRLGPLLAHRLRDLPDDALPEDTNTQLRTLKATAARRSLGLTGELLRLVDRFQSAAIDVTPLKGPTLAARLYPDLALRPHSDLDLLVRPVDVARARDLLLQTGFVVERSLASVQARRVEAIGHHQQFRHTRLRYQVELHFRLDRPGGSLDLSAESLWPRRETIELGGRAIPVLTASDLLLYLAHHGARHQWDRLIWLSDVARLLVAEATIADSVAWDRPDDRRLRLALFLARALLDAPLNDKVLECLAEDRPLQSLASQVIDRLAVTNSNAMSPSERLRFRLGCETSHRARLRGIHQLLLEPQVAELEDYPLPAGLGFLYAPLRLARLTIKHGRGQLRRSG